MNKEMTFGKAYDIGSRVVCGDKTLTNEDVKQLRSGLKIFASNSTIKSADPSRS